MKDKRQEERASKCSCELSILASSEMCAINGARDKSGEPTSNDKITIDFLIAISGRCKVTSCEVVVTDHTGEVVNKVIIPAAAGQNKFIWNLKDSAGGIVKQGCYDIEICAVLTDGSKCCGKTKVTVVEIGEIVARSKANRDTYIRNFKSPMRPRHKWAMHFLIFYRDMIIDIQNCFFKKLESQMMGGRVTWKKPCYLACVTSNLAELLNGEFRFPNGKIWKAAEEAGIARSRGWPGTIGFINDILDIENKLRGEAMYKCCTCTFTTNDLAEVVKCVSSGIPGSPPSCFISRQMEFSKKHCLSITSQKPVCPIPPLK